MKCPHCNKEVFGKSHDIEQELEVGLKKAEEFIHYGGLPRKVFRIFLPAAKYNSYITEKKWDGYGLFHDIPVFSYSGDKIIYCTD